MTIIISSSSLSLEEGSFGLLVELSYTYGILMFICMYDIIVLKQQTLKPSTGIVSPTMMQMRTVLLAVLSLAATTTAFQPSFVVRSPAFVAPLKAAESEVSFGDLNGDTIRIGIIRTRWNDEHVSKLVTGIRSALSECQVKEENIFETEVPGSFELPLAAKFLAMSGTVDAIVATGVLIKGDTMHFEYIAESVSSGLMSVGLQTNTPVVFGVLTCMNEDQVKARSSEGNNHGYDWGKTAVEMGLLRQAALGVGKTKTGKAGGFNKDVPTDESAEKKERVGFF